MVDITALPTMLIGAIRRGAWISPEAFRMRETARAIQQGQNAGIDVNDLTLMLARVASVEIENVTIRTAEVERIESLVLESVMGATVNDIAAEAVIRQSYGRCRTAEELHAVTKRFIADRYEQIDTAARIA